MIHETTHYQTSSGLHFTITVKAGSNTSPSWLAEGLPNHPNGLRFRSLRLMLDWLVQSGAKEVLPAPDPRFDGSYLHPDGTRITIKATPEGVTVHGLSPRGGLFTITIFDVAAYISLHNLTRVFPGDPSRAGVYESDGFTVRVTAADAGYDVDEGAQFRTIYDLDAYLAHHQLQRRDIPAIGKGVTLHHYADSYAGTIVAITTSGKRMIVREDKHTRTDTRGMSPQQDYSYEPDPDGREWTLYLNKKGQWKVRSNSSIRVGIGYRRYHFSYEF